MGGLIACFEMNGIEWYYRAADAGSTSAPHWTTNLEDALVFDDPEFARKRTRQFCFFSSCRMRTLDEIHHDKYLGKNKFRLV